MNGMELACRVLDQWIAFQQASILAVVTLWEETMCVRSLSSDPTARHSVAATFVEGPGRLWPETTLKITGYGSYVIPAINLNSAHERILKQATEWAASALNFPPPLGLIFLRYTDPE